MAQENVIIHYAGIRVRVVGEGNFRPTLLGYNDILTTTLVPITLSTTDYRQKDRLTNFISQQAKIKVETTAIDEHFLVNSMTIFVKPIWSEYPQ